MCLGYKQPGLIQIIVINSNQLNFSQSSDLLIATAVTPKRINTVRHRFFLLLFLSYPSFV